MEELKRKKGVSARYAVISDVHITKIREGLEPFEKTLELFSRLDVDGYIYVGDLTYMVERAGWGEVCTELYPEAYDMVNEAIERYASKKPKLCAIGNHEFPQGNKSPELNREAIELFETKLRNKINDHKVIAGYDFITIGGWLDENVFTKETEEWAMKEIDLSLAKNDKQPVFIVFHKPPYNTVVNSEKEPKLMSEKFRSFLNSRQRVINLTGDLHTPVQEPKTIWQDGFTVIHCPLGAVGDITLGGCRNEYIPTYDKYSQALLLDIENDVVSVYRLDTLEGKQVSKPWVIDVNDKASWRYTNKRFEADIVPYFEDGVCAEYQYSSGVLSVKVKDAVCEENDIESFVLQYDVVIKDENNCEVVSETESSDYYLTKRSGYFMYTKEIELSGKYSVEIIPESTFCKKGKPLTFEMLI